MASSIARSAAAVSAVADGATPSSATASAAASRRAAGSRIDVLEVGDSSASSNALIRSTAFCPAMTEVYHVYVVQSAGSLWVAPPGPPADPETAFHLPSPAATDESARFHSSRLSAARPGTGGGPAPGPLRR